MKELEEHLTQSDLWGEFKTKFGTDAIRVGDIQFTKHKLPFLPFYVAYSPRVNFLRQKFSWKELKAICKKERIIFVRFDVPNITVDEAKKGKAALIIKDINDNCKISPKSTFSRWNILMDISKSEEELIASFSQKTRYNIRLAVKKGATVKVDNSEKGFNAFYTLLQETSKRHKYFIHPRRYYYDLFQLFLKKGMVNILVCKYNDEHLASWMLFNYKSTLYYPYGGSSENMKNIMGSNLIAWEAIRLGKQMGCDIFDMWGATNQKDHPWWGFTRFKLGYGGELVQYIDSYDFIVNKPFYFLFNFSYNTFWKIVNLIRGSHSSE